MIDINWRSAITVAVCVGVVVGVLDWLVYLAFGLIAEWIAAVALPLLGILAGQWAYWHMPHITR